MRKILLIVFTLGVSLSASGANGQTGTPHGVLLSETAATQGSDKNTISGYNFYRCIGNASACTAILGTWVKLNTALNILTSYLDPSSDLAINTTYSYASTSLDSAGDESAFSNIFTIAIPATLPINPNPPTGLTGVLQ